MNNLLIEFDEIKDSLNWKEENRLIKEVFNHTTESYMKVIFPKEISSCVSKPVTFNENSITFVLEEPINAEKFNFLEVINNKIKIENINNEDYLMINAYPSINYSFLYLPFIENLLSQYISNTDIIKKVINYRLSKEISNSEINIDFIIGFNSNGASSSINHLHFQMFLFKKETKYDINKCIYFRSDYIVDRQIINKKDISIKKCRINKFVYYRIDYSFDNIESISTDIFLFIHEFNNMNICYNILFHKDYIIFLPRKDTYTTHLKYYIGILELVGIYICYSNEEYEKFDIDEYNETIYELTDILDIV